MNKYDRNQSSTDSIVRTNGQVRYPQVRLLDENRQFVGVMSSRDAFFKAKDMGLDLIELAANANPPVCFIGNADKYTYELKKKDKEKKKNNKVLPMKEIQIRPNIADNDAKRKISEADKFLSQGHRVRMVVPYYGRERGRMEELSQKMQNMVVDGITSGKMDGSPSIGGNRCTMMFVPSKEGGKETDSNAPTKEATIQES